MPAEGSPRNRLARKPPQSISWEVMRSGAEGMMAVTPPSSTSQFRNILFSEYYTFGCYAQGYRIAPSRGKTPLALIFVADDSSTVREILSAMLRKHGHTVVEACDGNECIALFSFGCPDLVISDIFMPEKDGIETIVHIRKTWPQVKIIAISGGGTTHDMAYLNHAKGLGADETLPKHFGVQRLIDTVTRLLLH